MAQHNERSGFIEEVGLLFEGLGVTRMAGRIMGYLMVSDKEMVSFDELTQVLQASKSSISTNLKSLVHLKFIKPISVPGDRKTYYMLNPDLNWETYFETRFELLKRMLMLFKKGIDLRVNKKDKPATWINEAINFYEWISLEYPKLLKKYRERNNNPA